MAVDTSVVEVTKPTKARLKEGTPRARLSSESGICFFFSVGPGITGGLGTGSEEICVNDGRVR